MYDDTTWSDTPDEECSPPLPHHPGLALLPWTMVTYHSWCGAAAGKLPLLIDLQHCDLNELACIMLMVSSQVG
jgi:hypothetical protein